MMNMEAFEIFEDKKTGKRYAKVGENFVPLEQPNTDDLFKVDTKKHIYKSLMYVENNLPLEELLEKEWHLKDVLYVPVGDKVVPFRVEHVANHGTYFVSVDCMGFSPMNKKNRNNKMPDMEEYLDNLLKQFPSELVEKMGYITHKVNGVIEKSKLSLLSRSNVDPEYHEDGVDDVLFEGLKTEAERCKNDENGETRFWWLRSPYAGSSTYFNGVTTTGGVGYDHYASYACAVVPCFFIPNNK